MNHNNHFFTGYIEGYFGKILTWDQRFLLLDHLRDLSFNSYFYAPKEDPYHRIQWRQPYPDSMQNKLKKFATLARTKNIEVFTALAPGLSFDYLSNDDYDILVKKFKTYFQLGINSVALLMDDIPAELPQNCKQSFKSLGEAHGQLLQKLLSDLKKDKADFNLWFCPTIYTDQFVKGKAVESDYIRDLAANFPEEITLLWTGPRVISETITMNNSGELFNLFKGNVVIWDNLYANDYAPLRLFLGTFTGREANILDNTKGIMINPTGLFHTDQFLLSLYASFLKNKNASIKEWQRIATNYKIPETFHQISRFFWLPFTKIDPEEYSITKLDEFGNLYDDFIVRWINSPLKCEWYPYLMAFYNDTVYLQKEKSKLDPWIFHRYPPVIAQEIKKKVK